MTIQELKEKVDEAKKALAEAEENAYRAHKERQHRGIILIYSERVVCKRHELEALEELLIEAMNEEEDYTPSAPWNAPGMRVSDFI